MLFEIIFTYLFIFVLAAGYSWGRRQGIKEKEDEAWMADIRAKEKEAAAEYSESPEGQSERRRKARARQKPCHMCGDKGIGREKADMWEEVHRVWGWTWTDRNKEVVGGPPLRVMSKVRAELFKDPGPDRYYGLQATLYCDRCKKAFWDHYIGGEPRFKGESWIPLREITDDESWVPLGETSHPSEGSKTERTPFPPCWHVPWEPQQKPEKE